MALTQEYRLSDVDVFTVPHFKMKHLLAKASEKVEATDFTSSQSFSGLLSELISTFGELKKHEEIENKYIMKILKRRLTGNALKKLLVHLHTHSHIADILNHVRKTEKDFIEGVFTNLKDQGRKLACVLKDFFDEYFPHMIEEEQVLQPMLMEYLSHEELMQIRNTVLQLHQMKEKDKVFDVSNVLLEKHFEKIHLEHDAIGESDSFKFIPNEVIVKIFSSLGPRDLCRCAQVNKTFNRLAFTNPLWQNIHPTHWLDNKWRFGDEFKSDDCNCDCEPNYDLVTYSDDLTESSDDINDRLSENARHDGLFHRTRREREVLTRLAQYVLPRVGPNVKTLVLECSKAVTNGLLFRMLSFCANIEYLDVSQTIISDLGLMGLFKIGCRNLKYFDISGCRNITDKVLTKLSSAIGKKNCKCAGSNKENMRQLRTLRLSGCFRVTNNGIMSLSKFGGLPELRHLDLSGCPNVTEDGIQAIVTGSPNLSLDELFYCDNITVDEQIDAFAGGCQNLECANRFCCRNANFVDLKSVEYI